MSTERGAVSGDGGFAERARIIARAEYLLGEEHAEFADDWAVINQASAAKSRVEALGVGGSSWKGVPLV